MSETPPNTPSNKPAESSADQPGKEPSSPQASAADKTDKQTSPQASRPSFIRRNRWRLAGGAVVGLVLALLLVVALLPSLISGGLLRGTLLGVADDAVQGKITWDKLQLRWGAGQRIEGLRIADDQGRLIAEVSLVDAPEVSLWSVIRGNRNLGTVSVVLKQADIVQLSDGQYNLQKALTPKASSVDETKQADKSDDAGANSSEPFGGLKVKVNVQGSDIHIKPLNAESVTIQNVKLAADLHDPATAISLLIESSFEQKNQPAGGVQGNVMLTQLFNQTGETQLEKAKVDAKLTVTKLPWSMVAALAGQDQSYAAIVGDELSIDVQANGDLLSPTGQLQIDSATMHGELKLVSTAGAFTVEPGASFALNFDGKGWQVWAGDSGTQLQAPVKLLAQIQQFSLPRTADGFDMAGLSASVDLSVSDVTIQGDDTLGRLSLTGTKAELRTENLGKKVSVVFGATASRNQQTGKISFNAVASDLADAHGQLGLSRVNADVQATATEMPIAVVDQVMGLGNMLASVLGPTLEAKLTANIRPTADGQAASGPFGLMLSTSQLKSSIAGKLTPEALELDTTSNVVLELTPEGATAAGLPVDTLQSATTVRFDIQQITIPRNELGLLPEQGKLLATVSVPVIALKPVGDIKSLSIQGFKTTITSQAIGSLVEINVVANAKADADQGIFTTNATITNLLGGAEPASISTGGKPGSTANQSTQAPKPMMVRFDIAANDLPVTGVEAFTGQQGVLVKWLGPMLAMKVQGELEDLKQGSMSLAMNTAEFKMDTKASIADGVLHVEPQSNLQLTMAGDAMTTQGVTLAQPMVVTVTLGDISLPVMPLAIDNAKINKLSIHTTPVQLAGGLAKTGYGISALEGTLVAPRLADGLTFNLQGNAQRNGAADSPIVVKAQVDRPLDQDMRATASVSVSKVAVAIVDMIAKQDGLLLALLGPELESLKFNARAVPNEPSQVSALADAESKAPWQIEFSARSTNLNVPGLKGQLIPEEAVVLTTTSPMTMRVTKAAYQRLMNPEPEAESAMSTQTTAPTATAKLQGKGSAVSRLLGSVLAAATRKDSTDKGVNKINSGSSESEPFELDGPLDLTFNIQNVSMSLVPAPEASQKPSKVPSTAVPSNNPQPVAAQAAAEPLDLKRVSLAASVELAELAYLQKGTGDRVSVRTVVASLAAPRSVGDSLTITVTGDTLATPGKSAKAPVQKVAGAPAAKEIPAEDGTPVVDPSKPVQGRIDTKIILKNLVMLPEGGVDFYHMDSHWDVAVSKLPSPILDNLAGQGGKLAGLLGGAADLTLTGDMPGDLDLKLHAPLTSADAKLTLTPERVVHLREDMAVQMVATPESVAMMGLLNPQLLALESTKRPIQLAIYQKEFSLPLPAPGEALDIKRVRGDMTLALGEVLMRKQGMVKTIYEVLGHFGGKFNTGQEMNVSFTQLTVVIKDGQVKTNDMWMISDELLMGTQAQIDMTQTPAFANVFVAISGQTLMKMPGARKDIKPDYVTEIKVASPLSEVKLDYAELVLQLTPLFVTTYAGKDGGKVLDIIGGTIDRLKALENGNSQSLVRVKWLNHPQPEVKTGEAETAGAAGNATTQPKPESNAEPGAEPKAEPKEPDVVDSIIDLFNKKKKK